jgi:hypothetical protein
VSIGNQQLRQGSDPSMNAQGSSSERERQMNYLLFIWADNGVPTADELTEIQRDLPAWIDDVNGRGIRLFGRELDLPENAATVRVRDGKTLVIDGPFAETKEFIAGFDVLACGSAGEAVDIAAVNPIARIQTLELRPLRDEVQIDARVSAFAQSQDGDAIPYLLCSWAETDAAAIDDATADALRDWRQDLDARAVHVLGCALAGPDLATTIRERKRQRLIEEGPFTLAGRYIATLDVVRCSTRGQAIELAATHPLASRHEIEVRPFYIPA